jgi:hypothetical protein
LDQYQLLSIADTIEADQDGKKKMSSSTTTTKKYKKSNNNKTNKNDPYFDPSYGIVMIVQPRDYNTEHIPPGPATHAVGDVQRLVAVSTMHRIPVIIVLPRFAVQHQQQHHVSQSQTQQQQSQYERYGANGRQGWINNSPGYNQSGYQQALGLRTTRWTITMVLT